MILDIKMSGQLYDQMIRDLRREHPFAAERVGFACGRMASCGTSATLVLLNHYHSIADDQYIHDQMVGARIGPEAMTWAMQAAYTGRPRREGIFHVHLHQHRGETSMSLTDARELPTMIPGFRSVGREAPHGIIILSLDHGVGWVWLPSLPNAVTVRSVAIVATPLRVFHRGSRT